MGVADTAHHCTVSYPPKKKWIFTYKQDEDRDEVALDAAAAAAAAVRPAVPPLAHQTPPTSVPPPPPPAHVRPPLTNISRSPSAFISQQHSYVRQPPLHASVVEPPAPGRSGSGSSSGSGSLHQYSRPPPASHHDRGATNGAGPAGLSPPAYVHDHVDERRGRVSAGTREVHNKLEKNRRAHLKECFEMLRRQVPMLDDKRTSNLGILRGALRYIASLKRKERECEHEMERLAREKIDKQQRLAQLKRDLSAKWDHIDFAALLPEPSGGGPTALHAALLNDDSNSTLSASERFEGSPEPLDVSMGVSNGGDRTPSSADELAASRRSRTASESRVSTSPVLLPQPPAGAAGGHSSGYSSSSPTVTAAEAGLAGLAAMASSQEKLLVAGRQVTLLSTQPGAETQLLRTEHGVYVPVTALGGEAGRPPTSVSYVGQPGEPPRKAILLETIPTHILPAQLMQGAGTTVRLAGGAAGLQLAPSSLQVLTPAGVRLLQAPAAAPVAAVAGTGAHTSGAASPASLSGAGTPPRAVLSLPRSPASSQPRPAPLQASIQPLRPAAAQPLRVAAQQVTVQPLRPASLQAPAPMRLALQPGAASGRPAGQARSPAGRGGAEPVRPGPEVTVSPVRHSGSSLAQSPVPRLVAQSGAHLSPAAITPSASAAVIAPNQVVQPVPVAVSPYLSPSASQPPGKAVVMVSSGPALAPPAAAAAAAVVSKH